MPPCAALVVEHSYSAVVERQRILNPVNCGDRPCLLQYSIAHGRASLSVLAPTTDNEWPPGTTLIKFDPCKDYHSVSRNTVLPSSNQSAGVRARGAFETPECADSVPKVSYPLAVAFVPETSTGAGSSPPTTR